MAYVLFHVQPKISSSIGKGFGFSTLWLAKRLWCSSISDVNLTSFWAYKANFDFLQAMSTPSYPWVHKLNQALMQWKSFHLCAFPNIFFHLFPYHRGIFLIFILYSRSLFACGCGWAKSFSIWLKASAVLFFQLGLFPTQCQTEPKFPPASNSWTWSLGDFLYISNMHFPYR